jgi:hypothetical protein
MALKVPSCATYIPAELGEGRIAAFLIADEGTSPRRVPRGVLIDEYGERSHVCRVERLVTASNDFNVLVRFVQGRFSFRYIGCW